ncbi:phosphatidylserine decarboxylase-domain-containing protein [Zychaea mexicana]|uniref:phosphatidylserine decarboxylase-domain-containing protein n=1 Tax=Zychaea mexicana TaxID=64656 RepID=UPI0022FF17F9|nr:phosphatidylserine decarboxylase-domain-containing protein [Zychaea mexicana]KAI9489700.1 phosphatidylserine decarboxylase-domain-containing protein [Zychaea mexicana]
MESGVSSDPGVNTTASESNGETTGKSHRMRLFHRSKSGIRSLISRPHSRTSSIDNEASDDNGRAPTPSSSSSTDSNEPVLQVSILRARYLHPKIEDSTNLNPYVIVSCAGQKQRTHVVKKSEDPDWQCTFDIKLPHTRRKRRLLWRHGVVITVCTKDRFKAEFLGQIRFPVERLFTDNAVNEAKWHAIQEPSRSKFRIRRRKNYVADEQAGELEIKFGLTHSTGGGGSSNDDELREMWDTYLEQYHPMQEIDSASLQPSDMEHLNLSAPPPSRPRFRNRQRTKSDNSLVSSKQQKKSGRVKRNFKRRKDYIAKFYSDVVGVAFFEISHANDLPPERNMTRTGFDMDPFVIVSYGTSTFRTRAIRHNLNPVWNEKLFFHVRENESKYKLKFALYDKDKITGHDYVAWKELDIADILHHASKKQEGEDTDSNSSNETNRIIKDALATDTPADAIDANMDMHTVDLEMVNKDRWQDRHPTLTFRVKFVPYTKMRKLFWVALAKNYSDDYMIGRLGVLSMLESLGSTISEATVNGFWEQHNKDPETDEMTLDELVESLENFMLSAEMPPTHESTVTALDNSDSSSELSDSDIVEDDDVDDDIEELELLDDYDDPIETPSSGISEETDGDEVLLEAQGVQYDEQSHLAFDMSRSSSSNGKDEYEQVIRLAECPICHRPNLSKRAQMDIVTHVAMCAANDWTTVDRFLMGDFVTEAHAQRRWFVKLVSKVGYGRYQLGRNNANIIVQDRRTGQLIEERMSVYVRLGMRLIYKGMKTGIQSKTAQRVLTNMTFKQGRRYDSPHSAREIGPFIKFHNLDLSEVLDPLDSFKTFNEFFYRKLKPEARPCECPDDPSVAVSPADCRMMAFATIDDATRLWIKGIEFSVAKLLDDPVEAEAFEGGALAIFRLAPQDYHRFHSPVDGKITDIKYISGQYYTVNPMAIRTTLDVYGDNARAVVTLETEAFGKVAVVLIGAMMVGSIVLTPKTGDYLSRTDELGYFAFGGSTIVVLWEQDTLTFDRDLLENSEKTLETLVRVGNRIGNHP